MTITSRSIQLTVGFILAMTSFLLYTQMEFLFGLLLITGSLVLLISWGTALFKKGAAKTKLILTFVFILYIVIITLSAPFIVDSSYRIYIAKNKTELSEINNILKDKKGDIEILNDDINDINEQLTASEKNELLSRRRQINAFLIHKTGNCIFYGLSGYLDVRTGIRYCTIKERPGEYRHLTGSWFR